MRVTKIEFCIETDDGRRAEVIFARRDKIEALLQDSGKLGDFLRAIVVSIIAGARPAPFKDIEQKKEGT